MPLTEQEQFDLLRAEMDRQGVTDNQLRAGIAAIAMGESALNPHTETGYAHTNNARIRAVFGSRVSALTDPQLDTLKADPEAFFNRVYGGTWGANNLGNTQDGDGFKYRGRTVLQLTGRANYQKLQDMTGYSIVDSPDGANEPRVSAAIAVAYMRWRYGGGGWAAMKAAVGNNTPDIDATKNAFFQKFTASGEFNYKPPVIVDQPDTVVAPPIGPTAKIDADPVISAFYKAAFDLQQFLKVTPDSDFGPGSRAALLQYIRLRDSGVSV